MIINEFNNILFKKSKNIPSVKNTTKLWAFSKNNPQFDFISEKCYNYCMRRNFTFLCLSLFMVSQVGLLGALEFEFKGGTDSMTWQPDISTANGIYNPYTFFIGNLNLRDEISSAWAYSFNFERDNTLWNTIDFRLKTRTDYFGFEFGTYIGISDAFGAHEMGILGSMEVTWPGILFCSIGGSSTVGAQFDFTGDDFRETAELKLGFWLPFVMPMLSISTKSFTEHINDWVFRTALTRFQLSAEFFGKTSPVAFTFLAGYQTLTRDFIVPTYKDPTDEMSSVFVGFDFQYSIVKNFRLIIGGEVPVTLIPSDHLRLQNEIMSMKYYGGFIFSIF